MPHDPRTIVPRLNPSCNVRSLPIGPEEAFVLSRIDGSTNAAELASMTGLGDRVGSVLEKLASVGAVLGVPVAPAPAEPPRADPPPSSAAPAPPPSSAPKPTPKKRSGPPKWNAAELEEACDLEPEKRRRILDVFYDLDELDHYALLGVARDADKKAIKAAYYALAPEFHPDKYFRKNLGAFKPKMEAVFKRITEAQETLARSQTRAEYDAYLAERERNESIERLLRGEFDEDIAAPAVSAEPEPPPSPAAPETPQPAPEPPPQPTSLSQPPPAPPPRPTSSATARTPEDERLRRQMLAAKLASGRFPLRPPSRVPPPPAAGQTQPGGLSAKAAAETLRRMQAAKAVDDKQKQLERYVAAAESAAERNDAVTAANAFHLASTMNPDDTRLQQAKREWAAKAASQLAEGYLRQGDYEAKEGKWVDAARSYVRAAGGMGENPAVLAKAANAIFQAQGDLHQAADFARRATTLAPAVASHRVVLAEIYLAANLVLNAKREAEAAAKIAPQDDKVRALLKRVG